MEAIHHAGEWFGQRCDLGRQVLADRVARALRDRRHICQTAVAKDTYGARMKTGAEHASSAHLTAAAPSVRSDHDPLADRDPDSLAPNLDDSPYYFVAKNHPRCGRVPGGVREQVKISSANAACFDSDEDVTSRGQLRDGSVQDLNAVRPEKDCRAYRALLQDLFTTQRHHQLLRTCRSLQPAPTSRT